MTDDDAREFERIAYIVDYDVWHLPGQSVSPEDVSMLVRLVRESQDALVRERAEHAETVRRYEMVERVVREIKDRIRVVMP